MNTYVYVTEFESSSFFEVSGKAIVPMTSWYARTFASKDKFKKIGLGCVLGLMVWTVGSFYS